MKSIVPDLAEVTSVVREDTFLEVMPGAHCMIILRITDETPEKTSMSLVLGAESVVECVLVYDCTIVRTTSVVWHRELAGKAKLQTTIALVSNGTHALHRTTALATGGVLDEGEFFLGKENQSFSLTHEVINAAPNTKATVLTKGVLLDQSKAFCKGNMVIASEACQSSSWLGQHVLLLSKDAKADAVPCLEIKNNDVKAYHAATVAPLDEQHLFYLTARGINLADARRMIAEAFLFPLTERIAKLQVQEFLQRNIHSALEVKYVLA